jgi:AraC family transcriptional regulator
LTFRHRSVLDVALEAGFEGPESFARSFKKHFGQTPSEWRDKPDWFAWHELMEPLHHFRRTHMPTTLTTDAVRIVDFPKTRIAVLSHRGDHRRLGESIRTFIAWRRENHLSPRVSATFNLLYGDPDSTPPDEFRMDICAAVNGAVPPNDLGIVEGIIPAGRCATLRMVGSDQGLGLAMERLYREWLPSSGEELRDFPPFVQRVTFYPEVPESEMITDIFLPLKF